MKKLRISSQLNLHPRLARSVSEDIKNGLEFNKEIGFGAADLYLGVLDLQTDAWRAQTEHALLDSQAVGLPIELCHLPYFCGKNHDDAFYELFNTKMYNAIDAAAILGVNYAVLHPNTDTQESSSFNRVAEYDSVMRHLSVFSEYAVKRGVKLAVENMPCYHMAIPTHRYCQSPDELCDIADALGIGVCWDFGHANISGIKQSEGLSFVGKRLVATHVNDNFGIGDDHVAPYMGNIDWYDAMLGLNLAGYGGLFNYELTINCPNASRKPLASYLVKVAEEIISFAD